MFHTYVLKSEVTGKRYIGYTPDLYKRFEQHQRGTVPSTKFGIPWTLVYYEACLDKDKAVQREKYLKTGYGRRSLKDRL
ncbi:GIY-YIG nuclease family protein [Candidatus Uhrbacteria bacterium]|nr:GIY-YIG nuclease family protein [Candidatus Uhrbacteria bacterium]